MKLLYLFQMIFKLRDNKLLLSHKRSFGQIIDYLHHFYHLVNKKSNIQTKVAKERNMAVTPNQKD